jgi:hypothetical protein
MILMFKLAEEVGEAYEFLAALLGRPTLMCRRPRTVGTTPM